MWKTRNFTADRKWTVSESDAESYFGQKEIVSPGTSITGSNASVLGYRWQGLAVSLLGTETENLRNLISARKVVLDNDLEGDGIEQPRISDVALLVLLGNAFLETCCSPKCKSSAACITKATIVHVPVHTKVWSLCICNNTDLTGKLAWYILLKWITIIIKINILYILSPTPWIAPITASSVSAIKVYSIVLCILAAELHIERHGILCPLFCFQRQ